MPSSSSVPPPLFQMTLRVRLPKEPQSLAVIADKLRPLGVAVDTGEAVRETSTFVIRELIVSCQQREQSEAVLKTVRAIDGAELMSFSLSR